VFSFGDGCGVVTGQPLRLGAGGPHDPEPEQVGGFAAVQRLIEDADVLLEFYKYPAEHWIHLRTTNPIESTFATVRLRTKVTKGPGSRAAGIAMAYKLIDAAQARWRALNAPHLVALVRAGATFRKGKLLERPVNITPEIPDADPKAVGSEVA
jgi:putative transposase